VYQKEEGQIYYQINILHSQTLFTYLNSQILFNRLSMSRNSITLQMSTHAIPVHGRRVPVGGSSFAVRL
jgi:hypothetical protein